MIPHFSNNNYHHKSLVMEGNIFSPMGAGNFDTLKNWIIKGNEWKKDPWEIVSNEMFADLSPEIGAIATGKSEKANPNDPV
jgi:hypothetical protein